MRKAILFLVILASSVLLFSSDLSFSGGKSSLSLKEGKEEVVLSEGAHVAVDDLVIDSERITLKGEGWTEVTCSGKTVIVENHCTKTEPLKLGLVIGLFHRNTTIFESVNCA